MKGVFSMNSLSTNQFYLDENKKVISPTSSHGATSNFGPRVYSAAHRHVKEQGTGYDARQGTLYKSMDMSAKKAEPQSSMS
mmetsp:Transcript_6349/g.10324  ORF Transcript_6349/g.10324 Transcript_6349/m.10324 type:complete len:81 (+) Transcript_6349:180-422(+)